MDTPTGAPPSLSDIVAQRPPVHDVNLEVAQGIGRLERVALFITKHVGTMGFFLIIASWTAFWLGWNLLAPKNLQFDPPTAFVCWLFISNMIQILLMPLIMVGQNLQADHAEHRAQSDYEVNLKAEREVEAILHHLEYQNRLILLLLTKQGVTQEELGAELKH